LKPSYSSFRTAMRAPTNVSPSIERVPRISREEALSELWNAVRPLIPFPAKCNYLEGVSLLIHTAIAPSRTQRQPIQVRFSESGLLRYQRDRPAARGRSQEDLREVVSALLRAYNLGLGGPRNGEEAFVIDCNPLL